MSGARRKPGRLGPYVEGYRTWLLKLWYSPLSVTRSLTALGHLGEWMTREGVHVAQLDAGVVGAFLADHVKDRHRLPTASLVPLLDHLRSEGVVAPEPAGALTALDRLIDDYRDSLLVERGLAASTVRARVALARRFLAQRISPGDKLGLEQLSGADVTGFLLRECTRVKLTSAGCYANHLRSLLRFLSASGLTHPGLADCVPSLGSRRDTAMPQTAPRAQIERLLSSCDRSTVSARVTPRSSRCWHALVCAP